MMKKRYVKIEITSSEFECGKFCEFNDSGVYCQLFDKAIGNSEESNVRCKECLESEIKEET